MCPKHDFIVQGRLGRVRTKYTWGVFARQIPPLKSSISFGTALIPYLPNIPGRFGTYSIPVPYTSVSSVRAPKKLSRVPVYPTKHTLGIMHTRLVSVYGTVRYDTARHDTVRLFTVHNDAKRRPFVEGSGRWKVVPRASVVKKKRCQENCFC